MANGKITKEQREAIEEVRGELPDVPQRRIAERMSEGVYSIVNWKFPVGSHPRFAQAYGIVRRYDARQKKIATAADQNGVR